ncbi:MAG: divergent polysaccharide deacetylase family protein [Rhodobacteraceae bacterium]|nr:divergent polysaccharide deacetylase family protein [Paracoccaceae bacterium]
MLAVASLLGEVPGRSAPQASQLEVPAGSGFDQFGVDVPVAPPAIQPPAEPQSSAPLVTAPEAPVAPSLSGDVTSSASIPQTGGVEVLAQPPAGASDSGVVLRAETAPVGDANTGISTPTAEPAPETSSAPAAPIEVAEPKPAPEPEPELAAAPEETTATEDEAPQEEEPTVAAEVPAAPEEEAPEEEVAAVEPVTEPVTETEPEATEAAPTQRPQATAGGFGNRANGVTVNRLTDSQQAEEKVETATDVEPQDPRAIIRNAMTDDWAGPDDRPLVSFILIDEAGDAALLGALGSFDGPLTFALPATASQAARDRYRNAGHEIVVIADIPEAAQPSDIEVVMEGSMIAVPEAVAVLDGTLSGFRGDRRVAEQVVDILGASGHGMVTVAQGLDAASQIAGREGVPSGTIYRDLDAQGQNNSVIRRFLDQAAFRAQQEGQVILLGRLKAETISALLIWHQQDRASRVNLAPLSAVLLAE